MLGVDVGTTCTLWYRETTQCPPMTLSSRAGRDCCVASPVVPVTSQHRNYARMAPCEPSPQEECCPKKRKPPKRLKCDTKQILCTMDSEKKSAFTKGQCREAESISLCEVPGIRPGDARRLCQRGYRTLQSMLDKLMFHKYDKFCFVNWLVRDMHMRRAAAEACYCALLQYHKAHNPDPKPDTQAKNRPNCPCPCGRDDPCLVKNLCPMSNCTSDKPNDNPTLSIEDLCAICNSAAAQNCRRSNKRKQPQDECQDAVPTKKSTSRMTSTCQDDCPNAVPTKKSTSRMSSTCQDECPNAAPTKKSTSRMTSRFQDEYPNAVPTRKSTSRMTNKCQDECPNAAPTKKSTSRMTSRCQDECPNAAPTKKSTSRMTSTCHDECPNATPTKKSTSRMTNKCQDECPNATTTKRSKSRATSKSKMASKGRLAADEPSPVAACSDWLNCFPLPWNQDSAGDAEPQAQKLPRKESKASVKSSIKASEHRQLKPGTDFAALGPTKSASDLPPADEIALKQKRSGYDQTSPTVTMDTACKKSRSSLHVRRGPSKKGAGRKAPSPSKPKGTCYPGSHYDNICSDVFSDMCSDLCSNVLRSCSSASDTSNTRCSTEKSESTKCSSGKSRKCGKCGKSGKRQLTADEAVSMIRETVGRVPVRAEKRKNCRSRQDG